MTEDGTTKISGTVGNEALIDQEIYITEKGDLTSSASNIGGETLIADNGTLNLTGGDLIHNVIGVAIGEDGKPVVANVGNVNITSGETTSTAILNVGELNIEKSATLISDASSIITAENKVSNDGTLTFNAGTNYNEISGEGTTNIAGEVINNALISQAIKISSDSLTTSADLLGGTVDVANGTMLDLTEGTLNQNITALDRMGGNVKMSGDITWGTNAKIASENDVDIQGSLDIGLNKVDLGKVNLGGDASLKISVADLKLNGEGENIHGSLNTTEFTNNGSLILDVASDLLTAPGQSSENLTLITAGNDYDEFASMLSNARYTVSAIDGETGKYKISYEAGIEEIIISGGGNQNHIDTGVVWDNVDRNTATGIHGDVADALYASSVTEGDEKNLVKGLTDLAPTNKNIIPSLVHSTNNQITGQVTSRMDTQGLASGDSLNEPSLWAQTFYNHSKEDSSTGSSGFSADTTGIIIGADGKIDSATTLGLGYSLTNTSIDSGGRDIDNDAHSFFIYGKYQPSKWYAQGMLSYGFAHYDEHKDVLGVSVKGDYDVENYSGTMLVGYDMDNGFTPEGGLRYTRTMQDSYTDTAGQYIATDDADILTAIAAVEYKTDIQTKEYTWTPKARLGMTYDVISDSGLALVQLGADSYQVDADRLDRFGVEAGVGVETSVDDWDFSVDYEVDLHESFTSQTGFLKATYNF